MLHQQTVERLSHAHGSSMAQAVQEKRTLQVVLLTLSTMVVEIIAGTLTSSMALLADGWHMGTHAFALGISYIAYRLARKYSTAESFTFGTGKFGVLAGYTSALFLGAAAIWMIVESVSRFFRPLTISFDEAIAVSVLGLIVNVVSVFLLDPLGSTHDHAHHDHDHAHHDHEHHHHEHHDHNYRAAYLHVLADALTSVLAIAALVCGRFLGWAFMDPLMGIVGGILISRWSYGLLRNTALILVDGGVDEDDLQKIRGAIEDDAESRIADLHVWRTGSRETAVVLTIVSGAERTTDEYEARLSGVGGLSHVSIAVHPCDDGSCPCRCESAT